MAKIDRIFQKIFGIDSGVNQVGQFGSRAAGTPIYTTNPETIQALQNFEDGWYSAVLGNNSPAIQDMNAICYLYAYQLAYLFQAGIPEWDDETVYYIGSYCQKSGVIYRSLIDDNTNFDPDSSVNWVSPLSKGLVTADAVNRNLTILSGQTQIWGSPTIGVGVTITLNTGSNAVALNKLISNGTVIVSGTAIMKVP